MKTRPTQAAPDPHRPELSRTIRIGAVRPAFQPIVDLTTGVVVGVEALCRPAPGSAFRDASELFAAAERLRMLWPLEAVARRASLDAAGALSPDARLFMNCSPQVVSDPRFIPAIDEAIESSAGLTRGRLVLEITERSDHRITRALARRAEELKGAGLEIAIDDVGAGMSGLSRIMALRPHWLKLDMDLIRGIHLDRFRQNLVRAIGQFAARSGIRLVAEGIELEEELETIAGLGVRYAQGYYLCRPVERPEDLARAVGSHAMPA